MVRLFESTAIGVLTLKNRIVRSATHEGLADDRGYVTVELEEIMNRLARGGVGLIISGHAYVSSEGQASPRQLGIDRDECIPGLVRLSDFVHREGGRVILQLAHAGSAAREKITGCLPMGPTALRDEKGIVRAAAKLIRARRPVTCRRIDVVAAGRDQHGLR